MSRSRSIVALTLMVAVLGCKSAAMLEPDGGSGESACDEKGTVCAKGQICLRKGLAAQIVSATCVPDPCAPGALDCACAKALCEAGEVCMNVRGGITCQAGKCASPSTPIATPSGERPISEIQVGDQVFSMHQGSLQAVPVRRTHRTRVFGHQVVRVELRGGGVLEISGGHPTAEGGTFADLRPGGRLGKLEVGAVKVVPYLHPYTYDILPDSDTGTYVAGGALIGSTLRPAQPR